MATQGRRRALGQHFLKDKTVARMIAESAIEEAERHSCSRLLEIGPGKGAITLPILDLLSSHPSIQSFQLVERDQSLADHWKTLSSDRLKVASSDFLELPVEKWLESGPLAVVSNLPYSAGTAILNRLDEYCEKIPVMVLMFQAEVAQRLRANPSEKARGSLSLWIQNKWDVQKLLFVPPSAFSPPPEVDSEVVILTRRKEPQVLGSMDPQFSNLWRTLLKLSFSQRRQMLRKIMRISKQWQNALELSGLDGTKRAESLQWEEWNQLFQAVCKSVSLPTS